MPEIVIGLLLAAAGLVWRFAFDPPERDVELWLLLTAAGGIYLAIGLVRDVMIKLFVKPGPPCKAEHPTICLESTIGPIVVAVGLAVLLIGIRFPFRPSYALLIVALGGLFAVSGLLKNVVVSFRIEKNHSSFLPW